jgi:hypothetical protein
MRYFKVLYDFQASDTVELTVKKGDLVCAPSDAVEQDGWMKVELASDTRRKGFVPATYLRETTTIPQGRTPQQQPQVQPSYNRNNSSAMIAVPLQDSSNMSGLGVPLSPGPAVVTPASVTEAFMKNEVYFKQLMKQRQEALAKLEMGIGEAVADVAACKDKNATLARKLRDLDATIEKERKKWAQRVDEEKALVQRSAATGPSFIPPQPSTGTGALNTSGYGGYGSRGGSFSGQQLFSSGADRVITTTTTTTNRSQQQSNTHALGTTSSDGATFRSLSEAKSDHRF